MLIFYTYHDRIMTKCDSNFFLVIINVILRLLNVSRPYQINLWHRLERRGFPRNLGEHWYIAQQHDSLRAYCTNKYILCYV